MKHIDEQFDKVAIEYDYVTSLKEGVDRCLIEHLPDRKIRALQSFGKGLTA